MITFKSIAQSIEPSWELQDWFQWPPNIFALVSMNSVMMNEASDLAIVATLIHETMHSYFVWGANNLTGDDMMAFRDLNRYLFDSETYDPLPPPILTAGHL